MRFTQAILITMTSIAALACTNGATQATPDRARNEPDVEEATEVAEQALGSCSQDCDCSVGFHCVSGTCQAGVVFGPAPNAPPCYGDCQCTGGNAPFCNVPQHGAMFFPGGYGYCAATRCSTSFSSSTVPSGGTVAFSFTTTGTIPPGAFAVLLGTKNGFQDETGQTSFPQTAGSFQLTNSPGLAGSYLRAISVRGPDNSEICLSLAAGVVFQ